MNAEAIIRAWKDPAYRASLSAEQRAEVPENPSGTPVTELDDSELGDVNGGLLIVNTSPLLCRPNTVVARCLISYRVCPTRVCTPETITVIGPDPL